MEKKIEELQARIKELESKLKSKESSSYNAHMFNIKEHTPAQFIANKSGAILQFNPTFLAKINSEQKGERDSDIILNFQKLNNNTLTKIHNEDNKILEFTFTNSQNKEEKLVTKVQKIKQVQDHIDLFQYTETIIQASTNIDSNNLDTLIENSPLAIYKTDKKGRCVYVNAKWRAISGCSQEEATGDGWIKAIYEEDREKITELWNKHSEGLIPWNNEYRFQDKKGKIFWVYGTTVAERDQNGNITGYIGNNLDVTAQKETKLKLEESEEKYRKLHLSSGFGVGYYSPDGIIISYNDIAAKNMGGKPEDFVGKSLHTLFPEDQANEYMSRIEDSIKNNIAKEYIDHISLPNKTFWFKSIYTNIFNSNSEIIGIQIISDDITQTKQLENKLKTITRSLENSLYAYDIVDSKGNIIYVNKAYVKMWGYDSSEEILGISANEHCFDHSIPKKIISEVNKNGELEIEFIAKRKDGSTFDVIMYIIKDIDEGGKTIYTGTSIDITESKRSQLDLKENEEKFRNFVDYTADGIAIIDDLGKIVFVNKAFCNIFGIQNTETKNTFSWELMAQMSNTKNDPEKHLKTIKDNVLNLLSQKGNIELDKNYTTIKQTHSKDERNIVETVFSFDTSKGKRLGIIIKDITEIKKAEEEIISTYKLLQDTEKISLSGSWTYNKQSKPLV